VTEGAKNVAVKRERGTEEETISRTKKWTREAVAGRANRRRLSEGRGKRVEKRSDGSKLNWGKRGRPVTSPDHFPGRGEMRRWKTAPKKHFDNEKERKAPAHARGG